MKKAPEINQMPLNNIKKDSLAGVAFPCIPFDQNGVWLPRN